MGNSVFIIDEEIQSDSGNKPSSTGIISENLSFILSFFNY